jgi:hypothetical protein
MRTVAILVPLIAVVFGQEGRRSLRRPTSVDFEARVPAGWNHLIEKNARQTDGLSMILPQKLFPLWRIML